MDWRENDEIEKWDKGRRGRKRERWRGRWTA